MLSEIDLLFMSVESVPVSFCLKDVPSPAAVTDLILSRFGRVTQDLGPHTVFLVPDPNPYEEVIILPYYNISVRYVEDCARRRKLLPLRRYWVNKTDDFDDEKFYKVKVMQLELTWDECKKRTPVPE